MNCRKPLFLMTTFSTILTLQINPRDRKLRKSFQLQTHINSSHYKQTTGKHVHNLLNNNCPLSPTQWGFTEGKSTTTALRSFVHECQDNGGEVCSVLFDHCKAFDSVPHQPLLCKLFHLQVNPFFLGGYIIIYL